MKKHFYFILLFFLFSTATSAQSINYIKFEGNNGEKGFKILTNKNYQVKLNPYLISNVLSSFDSVYDAKLGINLKLIGCNKDSLFFENGLGIPLIMIQSLDKIKQNTILFSSLLALNLSIIGIVNYNTIVKYNNFYMIILPNVPFIITGIVLVAGIPQEKNKFYLNKYHIKEFRYYNQETDKIYTYGIRKSKTIFD